MGLLAFTAIDFPFFSLQSRLVKTPACFLIFLAAVVNLAAQDKPNIILMMADDMGWSDIGCYGAIHIQTPNIDRIAAEGMLFTQFYNNAKCTTTRASLLTGLYPRNGGNSITKNMLTLGEALRMAGYSTGMSGKWHNGKDKGSRPFDRGFDEAYGLWDGCCNFFNPVQPDPKFKGGRVRTFGHNDEYITEFPEDFYSTDAFVDHAVKTIRQHAAKDKPFLHYIPFTAPHYPIHAKPEDIAKYKGKFAEGWNVLIEKRRARQIELGIVDPETWPEIGDIDRVRKWEEAKSVDEAWQNLRMEAYAAMVDSMDQGIGRILALLDEMKIADNTLVMFLSDNGACAETPGGTNPEQIPGPKEFYSHVGPGWAHFQNTPFRKYKATSHEGGVATPFVARWPKVIEAGSKNASAGHIIDLMPTFLEMAGGEYPSEYGEQPLLPLEGASLLPAFRGEHVRRDDTLFWTWSGSRAAREGDWKAVWDKKGKAWELYDLSRDRTETTNLAEQHPERLNAMATAWEDWGKRTGMWKVKTKKKKS